jgi:hypothetical protein
MNIFPSGKLSDAEFVEKIRKQLSSARRQAWLLLVFGMCHLGAIAFIWRLAVKYGLFQRGFAAGCFVGFFTGFAVMMAVMYFVFFLEHLFGYRKEKLLVALYDRLHPLDTKAPPSSTAEKSSR